MCARPFFGARVSILKGVEVLLCSIILIIKLKLSKLTKSNLENPGSNCFSKNSASSAPMRKAPMVPTLPKTAFLIWSVNWGMYWWAMVKFNLYFLASDKMVEILSVVKFWNSSTYK